MVWFHFLASNLNVFYAFILEIRKPTAVSSRIHGRETWSVLVFPGGDVVIYRFARQHMDHNRHLPLARFPPACVPVSHNTCFAPEDLFM